MHVCMYVCMYVCIVLLLSVFIHDSSELKGCEGQRLAMIQLCSYA